jgi:hypothetical protein
LRVSTLSIRLSRALPSWEPYRSSKPACRLCWATENYLYGRLTRFCSNPALSSDNLKSLCVDSCSSSLQKARESIQQSCTGPKDTIEYDGLSFPGSHAFA